MHAKTAENRQVLPEREPLAFLSEASKLLGSSLDYETTLSTVARLVVPGFGDWCGVDILDEYGTLRRLAVAHVDPEKVRWAHELQEKYGGNETREGGAYEVVKSGQAQLYSEIPDELLRASAKDEAHYEAIKQAEIRSAMVVPLNAHGSVLGVLSFVSSTPGRYDEDSLKLAQELADRAAAAVENSKLFKALHASEQLFRTTADSVPVLVWMSDTTGSCYYFNRHWLEFTGRKLEEEFGDGWLKGIHPDDHQQVVQAYEGYFATKAPFEMEYRLRRHDGHYRWILDKGEPRIDPDGSFSGFTGGCIDITERKEATGDLERLRDELEERVRQRTGELQDLNSDLEAFTSSVSHDLRAPLRSIRSFARILEEDLAEDMTDDIRDSLTRIQSSASRMSQLIEDLLSFARVGRSQLTVGEVDISALVASVIADFRRDGRCEDRTEFRVVPNVRDVADSKLLRIAFENLIDNACKFSAKAEHPVVEIGCELKDGNVQYYVRDNGVGFDPRYASKLFQAFERLHSTQEYAGTGIGLTTVNRIISKHQGKIWAASDSGKGATFYFTLGTSRVPGHAVVQSNFEPSACTVL